MQANRKWDAKDSLEFMQLLTNKLTVVPPRIIVKILSTSRNSLNHGCVIPVAFHVQTIRKALLNDTRN